jgi:hypothetical protein
MVYFLSTVKQLCRYIYLEEARGIRLPPCHSERSEESSKSESRTLQVEEDSSFLSMTILFRYTCTEV